MAEATITQISQAVSVGYVSDVVMTPISANDDGDFVREFRVFGPSPGPGGAGPLVFVLRVTGETEAAVELTTPQLQV